MPTQDKCPKCGSSEWIPDVTVMTQGTVAEGECAVMAEVQRRPRAIIRSKDPIRSPLKATVCGECGFTELHATEARELLSAYRTRQSSSEKSG